MNKKQAWLMAAIIAGANVGYTDEHTPHVHRMPRDGKKCGTCVFFNTFECPCKLAKDTSPACSIYSRTY